MINEVLRLIPTRLENRTRSLDARLVKGCEFVTDPPFRVKSLQRGEITDMRYGVGGIEEGTFSNTLKFLLHGVISYACRLWCRACVLCDRSCRMFSDQIRAVARTVRYARSCSLGLRFEVPRTL